MRVEAVEHLLWRGFVNKAIDAFDGVKSKVIEQLEQGEQPGDQISGVGYAVFKVRVRNSDNQKGKSGGYRLIYYLETTTGIILLTIYSKSEQVDIEADELRKIITDYDSSIEP